MIDQQNRIQLRKGLQRLFEEIQNPSDIVLLLNGGTVNGVLSTYLNWESGQVRDLDIREEGFLSLKGPYMRDINQGYFRNGGTVDVAEGSLQFSSSQTHSGTYRSEVGEMRFSGGVHTLTADLDLEGDKFYFYQGEFTGIIKDHLNWIDGNAVDLTIAAGSNLVLTDSSSGPRAWTGEIINRGRLEYKNEERAGDWTGRVVFGTSSKAARFINENEFALIGQYADLSSNLGLGGQKTAFCARLIRSLLIGVCSSDREVVVQALISSLSTRAVLRSRKEISLLMATPTDSGIRE